MDYLSRPADWAAAASLAALHSFQDLQKCQRLGGLLISEWQAARDGRRNDHLRFRPGRIWGEAHELSTWVSAER